ncbi:hypothetical protein O2W18_01030 [Modestobacter sp. VKM Ac-2983]|uniref:wax ester/triacylglycerol synthase domain-containing protein n=1 Tax=Modestobacter sp. VKM Ac-2983 TaxID=3004137 RepID=UPI0022ABA954|nr:wax ester/triacylglycerol synthase domain-containing protein [Modestobacter sp. VKM Ac-2983]MCZ2803683.1 hypothetical protein [Modestobacter sp. VKM Ac-2983]
MQQENVVQPLGPVEERFLRTLPGRPQHMTSCVYVLDGAGLRDAQGRLDFPALRRHLVWWGGGAPYRSTRLAPSLLGLTPPAWVSSAGRGLESAVRLWPRPCAVADLADVVAECHLTPVDLRVAPWLWTVVDDPAGPVGIVFQAHHAWADGMLSLQMLSGSMTAVPGSLQAPPVSLPSGRPLGAVGVAVELLRRWWADQPTWRAAARSWSARPLGARVRRVLGRQRWALAQLLDRRRPPTGPVSAALAFRWRELPLSTVSRLARENGGNVNELIAAATAHALVTVGQADASGGAPWVLVPMSARAGGEDLAANRVRVVPVRVDVARGLSEAVSGVRAQLRDEAPAGAGDSAVRVHATTMLGPRDEQHLGSARVEQWALMPSPGEDEDFAVIGFVRRRTVVVSVAVRDPGVAEAFADAVADVLSGRVPTTTGGPPR